MFFIFFGEKIVSQSISYNPFGLLRKNILYYLNEVKERRGVPTATRRNGTRRASMSGQAQTSFAVWARWSHKSLYMHLICFLQHDDFDSNFTK